jgi:hypothetical protein
MTAKAAAAESPWRPKEKLNEAISALAQLQVAETRDQTRERAIVTETVEYAHRCDNQDFMLYVKVQARSAFSSRYLPKAWLERRDDWARCGVAMCGSLEAAYRLESRPGPVEVESYLYDFHLGTELGYSEEMGDKWYLMLSDSTGTFYIPVDAVETVIGTSL